MSDATKKTQARIVPKTSQAPDPSTPIRGSGYRRKRDQLADYQHWNRMPVIDLKQAIMLTLGIEPGPEIYEPPNRKRYAQLEQLALSCWHEGTLPICDHNPDLIRSDDWLQWVRSRSDEEPPKEWQPIQPKSPNLAQEPQSSLLSVEAAIAADVYTRIKESNPHLKTVSEITVYNFLHTLPKSTLPASYGVSEVEYWLIDSKEDDEYRGDDVAHKKGLGCIKLIYTLDGDKQSISFVKLHGEIKRVQRNAQQN